MNARLILPLAAMLGVACVDTNPDTWCQSHPEICDTQLHAVTPAMGPTTGGTVVTLTGQALEEDGEIFFGDKALVTVSYDPSRTQATGYTQTNVAGPVTIRIVNRNGETTASGLFTFVLPTTVSAVSPVRGARAGGTRVQVTGTNIHPGSKLFLGALEATELQINSQGTLISGTAPPAATLGSTDVRVTGPGGTARLQDAFQYVAWERMPMTGVTDTGGFMQLERSGSSSTFYARTSSDLFRSPNNGDTWSLVPRPPGPEGYQQSLAVDPFTPERLYFVSNTLFWSGDSGQTWTRSVVAGGEPQLYSAAVAVRPSDGAVFSVDYSGLYRSLDGAVSFTRLSTLPFNPSGLCLDPRVPDLMLVLGYEGWRAVSTNGGQTFTASQEPAAYYSYCEGGLAANELWLADNSRMQVSTDGAATFQDVNPALPVTYTTSMLADPSGAGRYLVSDGWNIFQLDRADAIPAWTGVGDTVGGKLELDTNGLVLSAGSRGIFRGSARPGSTWTPRNAGLENPFVNSVAIDPSGPQSRLFIGTDTGKVFQTRDRGLTWEPLEGLGSRVTALAVSLQAGSPILYALSNSSAWYRPLSAGGVWTEAKDEAGAPLWSYELVSDPGAPSELFLQRSTEFYRKQVGGTFVLDVSGLPDPATHSYSRAATRPTGGGGMTVYTVAVSPGVPMQVYAHVQGGTWAPLGTPLPGSDSAQDLYSFAATGEGLLAYLNNKLYLMPFSDGQWVEILGETVPWYPQQFLVDPTDRTRVIALSSSSLYHSNDSGRTWRMPELQTYGGYVMEGVIDPSAPQSIYLSTGSAGVVFSHSGGE